MNKRIKNKEQAMNKKRIFVLLVIVFTLTAFSFAGIEWQSTIKTVVQKGKVKGNDIVTHVYAQDGNVKQVFEGVTNENMFYAQDSYWLYKADEDNVYIVNDKNKEYMVISIDGLLQMTGMVGQLVKIKIKDQVVNSEKLPNEKIEGYDCTHLKIDSQYTMKMKITIFKKTMKINEVKEIWATTEIPGLKDINKAYMNKDYKTGFEDLDQLIQEQMKQQKKIGFPMKVVTHSTNLGKKGKKVVSETITTMTVGKIKSKKFSKDFFEVPSGYEHVQGPWDKGDKKKLGIF
jgi:hypothetical protein